MFPEYVRLVSGDPSYLQYKVVQRLSPSNLKSPQMVFRVACDNLPSSSRHGSLGSRSGTRRRQQSSREGLRSRSWNSPKEKMCAGARKSGGFAESSGNELPVRGMGEETASAIWKPRIIHLEVLGVRFGVRALKSQLGRVEKCSVWSRQFADEGSRGVVFFSRQLGGSARNLQALSRFPGRGRGEARAQLVGWCGIN